jgi:hypothetical protein
MKEVVVCVIVILIIVLCILLNRQMVEPFSNNDFIHIPKTGVSTLKDNNNLLTIIVTASFIPSHPSIHHIKNTIESLPLINIPSNTKIILAHDYSNNMNYIKYFENLNNYINSFPNIEIVRRTNHGHLVGNIRNALQYVTSKYILVIQHDFPFISKFDIQKIIYDVEENDNIKHIRFNKRKNIKTGADGINNLFGLEQKQKNYTYTRTPAWSDNNHLCLTTYYTDIVMKECPDGYAMEFILYKKIKDENTHKKYGTYLFGGLNHKQVIKHTDGRLSKS